MGSAMGFTIYVRMKKLGKQKKESLRSIPYELEKRPDTVRAFLAALVELEAAAYNARRDEGQLVAYLTKGEIKDQADAGKVSFGLRGGKDADAGAAVENAIQCFEDGIYRVFAGDEEVTELEREFTWDEGCEFTFIRLAMLSGLNWGW